MFTTLEVEKEVTWMARTDQHGARSPLALSIPVVEGQKLRTGVPVVAGYIPAGLLIPNNYDIPTHDPRTGKGYQRPLQESRVNELVTDLKKGRVDLPTAILLNVRNRDARNALQDGHLRLADLRDMLMA